jgi:hypothetical protein
VLTPARHWIETTLELSENIAFLVFCRIQIGIIRKQLDLNKLFGEYHVCARYIVWGTGRYILYVLLRCDTGHWVVSEWKSDSTLLLSYITVCICYPQVSLLECLPRELALHVTVCLVTNCCSDVTTTAKCWCTLPEGTNTISMFGW